MEKVLIANKAYRIGGKVKGHYDDKFNRMAKLAARFDLLEKEMYNLLYEYGTDKKGQCALAVLLLMHTGIRVGNEDSAEGYYTNPHPNAKDQESKFVQTYGLTTLTWEHVQRAGTTTIFDFTGKKSVHNTFSLDNPFIGKGLSNLRNKAEDRRFIATGPNSFKVVPVRVFDISDYELNKFIKSEVGEQFSAKDFRCMRANLYASEFIDQEMSAYNKKGEFKKDLKRLYEFVASKLNNTPGVCKRSYVWDGLPKYLECLLN